MFCAMKPMLILVLLVSIIFLHNACNPSAGDPLITEFAKLNATISDTSENIRLGDTLTIGLRLPDTLITNSRSIAVNSLQRGFYSMRIFKIDTFNRTSIFFRQPYFWVAKGSTEGQSLLVMNNTIRPYEVIGKFKTPERGLYYLEVPPQTIELKINNDIRCNFRVGFATPNKHYSILSIIAPYFGGQTFFDAAAQRNNEGFGVYFFRVI
jgi:hypothetical protein